jgi:hypothetical protein
MGSLRWLLGLVVTFALGLAVGALLWRGQPATPEADHLRETVDRLQQQVSILQARLGARESLAAARATPHAESPQAPSPGAAQAADRIAAAAVTEDRRGAQGPGATAQPQVASQIERAVASSGARVTAPATVQGALDRFYRYLEAMNGLEGRERWQAAREVIDDLRAMGDSGVRALMQVLASGTDSEERRAAARMLGTLGDPEALPLLRDIIEKDDDLMLRRAAASGLRQLQTADAIPVMEGLLTNPGEDRFVRLSAAYGLAEAGKPVGVTGLTQIFAEAETDGRLRELAFRSLTALNDDRPLPFMRQIVSSQADPSYRLQAIRYITGQGDQQALGVLQRVMQSPNEQPSVRDAAAHAYAAISRK